MSGPAILPPMTCRKCGASNPVIFLAPVIVKGSGTCICLDCAKVKVVKSSNGFDALPPFTVPFKDIAPRWKHKAGEIR